MKGLYILLALAGILLVLGYFAVKPTDSDLRRSYDKLAAALGSLEGTLSDLQAPMAVLRQEKRRTAILDKEYDSLRTQASGLRMKLNVLLHNVENLSPEIRKATEDGMQDLEKSMQRQLAAVSGFQAKVNALYKLVTEGYPLVRKMEAFQQRMNQIAEAAKADGGPGLGEEKTAGVDSYNLRCEQVQSLAKQALTTLHTDLDAGQNLSLTAINEVKKLLPSLEAFVEDLERSGKGQ